MRIRIIALALATLLSATSQVNAAESSATVPNNPYLTNEWIMSVGVFYPNNSTGASLSGPGGAGGLVIDFENTLDLADRTASPSAGIFWRMSKNWRLDISYFDVSRSASRTLETTIEWGDQTFTTGDVVNSVFDFSDTRVTASYAFFRRQDKELGVGLGFHVADINSSISSSSIGSDSGTATAPLPVISLYGIFALTDEWVLDVRTDWLSMSYDKYSGDVQDTSLSVIYQPFKNVGFGLGLRSLTIDIGIDDPDYRGEARVNFQGPTAFVTATF